MEREFLKEYEIETVAEAFKRLKTLWKYCTEEWIVKVKLDRTRIERCSIDDTWLKIQNAFNEFKHASLIKRAQQLETNADALLPSIIGNITSYAARKGLTDNQLVHSLIIMNGNHYLEDKNLNFKKAVSKKMSLLKVEKESEVTETWIS